MSTITTKDGDPDLLQGLGPEDAQPIVFHHGWPLSSDDWDTQMLYFLGKGYRVVAIDRRGHGRSSQVSDGHDMDHYAADAAAVVEHLDLRNAVHIGHSTGGGEATRYVARHGKGRVAKLVLIGAMPPIMLKTPANPGGLPMEVFDGLRRQLAANRAILPGFRRRSLLRLQPAGREASQPVIENWWRQAMMGGAKAQYDGDQGLLGDRLHRRPEGHRRAHPGHARRRRPDRAHRRLGAVVGEAPEEGTLKVYESSRTACARRTPTSLTRTYWPSSSPDKSRTTRLVIGGGDF